MMRILWMSFPPDAFTGYATASRELFQRLCNVSGLELGFLAQTRVVSEQPATAGATSARDGLAEVLESFRPDIIVSFGDLDSFEWVADHPLRPRFRWWLYFTIDSSPLPYSFGRILDRADVCVAYSHFGHKVVKARRPNLHVEMIYLGVNNSVFRPLQNRRSLRLDLGLEDRFVVGCVARNDWRKQLPILLRAFARFSVGKQATLYLHTDVDGPGWDLQELLWRYGIAVRTIMPEGNSATKGVSAEKLNEIYNLFDVFALPTAGEGFGLPILEAMAAGVPVIATDCSACTELLENRGELLRVALSLPYGQNNQEFAIADEDHLVELLERLFRSPGRRVELAAKGRELALRLDWQALSEQWIELFRKHEGACLPLSCQ